MVGQHLNVAEATIAKWLDNAPGVKRSSLSSSKITDGAETTRGSRRDRGPDIKRLDNTTIGITTTNTDCRDGGRS
jgi:hypothetical protein